MIDQILTEKETLFEKRIQGLSDKVFANVNDMVGVAMSRIIEDRDALKKTLGEATNGAKTTANWINENVKTAQTLCKNYEILREKFSDLQESVSCLQSISKITASDIKAARKVVGKVVTLKSGGGINMTAAAADEYGLILCVWVVDGDSKLHEHAIPLAALQVVTTPTQSPE